MVLEVLFTTMSCSHSDQLVHESDRVKVF